MKTKGGVMREEGKNLEELVVVSSEEKMQYSTPALKKVRAH